MRLKKRRLPALEELDRRLGEPSRCQYFNTIDPEILHSNNMGGNMTDLERGIRIGLLAAALFKAGPDTRITVWPDTGSDLELLLAPANEQPPEEDKATFMQEMVQLSLYPLPDDRPVRMGYGKVTKSLLVRGDGQK